MFAPHELAGFWVRYFAYVIDAFIVGIPFLAVLSIYVLDGVSEKGSAFFEEPGLEPLTLLGNGALVLAMWLYQAYMTSSPRQATLGKMALGLIVTGLRGERISFARASVRFFASLLSAISSVGYLIQPFTPKRQSLHDVIAETLVYRR